MATIPAHLRQRYDTAANWTSEDPTLAAGEMGVESDTRKVKLGDGSTAWTSLAYAPVVAVGQIDASGTADDTTFLRGDGEWATPSGGSSAAVAAHAYATSAQTLPHATVTAITLDAENFDTDSFHDNATNNTRFTIPSDGAYDIAGQVAFSSTGSSGSTRIARIRLNGTDTLVDTAYAGTTDGVRVPVATKESLTAGDYIELVAYQTSGGGSLDTLSGREYTFLSISRIGS